MKKDKIKTYKIYAHINKINNKIYVGQTVKDVVKYRWGVNGIDYRHQPKFYNAIKKYGWNNFEHIILEDNIKTSKEANEREKYYIKKYDCIKNGYNVQEGGISKQCVTEKKAILQYDLDGNFIRKWSSISEAGESLKIAIGSIVKVCKHQLLSCGGYVWSYADDAMKAHKREAKTNARKVCQFDLNGNLIKMFDSQKQASIEITGNESSKSKICSCCKHKNKTALGYVWRYSDDEFSYSKKIVWNTRKVIQLTRNDEIIKIWNSFADVERELHIRQGNMYSCCVGKRETAGGYKWKYFEEK